MKAKKRILIISPALPDAINGLGDYAASLGNELKKLGLNIHYASLPQTKYISLVPYYQINAKDTIDQIVLKNRIDVIFLNYANYGYQKKGIPFWLLRDLRKVKDRKIHIFFHELNASSYKPWQLVFWLKPLQVYLYKNLAKIATKIYCSNDIVYDILSDKHIGKLSKVGIFSNIPEPTGHLINFSERGNLAVIFGSYMRRKLVYKQCEKINQFIKDFHVDAIIDIGNGDINSLTSNIDIPVIVKGILPNTEIAKIFTGAKYGFISYPSSMFGKSGIFAAYAAYGLPTLNLDNTKSDKQENLIEGIHYIPYDYDDNSKVNVSSISEQIVHWYKGKNLTIHSKHIYRSLLK